MEALLLGFLKVNSDVAIRSNGSYIAISSRDFTSSFYILYTEQLAAIDPLIGEAVALKKGSFLGFDYGAGFCGV